jgi:hypothetical protein
MANPIVELNAVFEICTIKNEVTLNNIIIQEGFTQLEDLRVLETDTDVTEMAKRMAMRMREGCCLEPSLLNDFRCLWSGGSGTNRNMLPMLMPQQ